jgi:hypothetical protein
LEGLCRQGPDEEGAAPGHQGGCRQRPVAGREAQRDRNRAIRSGSSTAAAAPHAADSRGSPAIVALTSAASARETSSTPQTTARAARSVATAAATPQASKTGAPRHEGL